MYFFFGDGELGNQIFQYKFIEKIIKKKTILISTNFKDLDKLITLDKKISLINFENKYLVFLLRRVLIWVFILFTKLRLISSINVSRISLYGNKLEKKKIITKKGLFNSTFIYPRFFQSEFFFNIKKKINIKPSHLKEAQIFFSGIPPRKKYVFIHYRQGKSIKEKKMGLFGMSGIGKKDYQIIEFLGMKGLALPDLYYKELIKFFIKKLKNPHFIILSDDKNYAKKKFSFLKKKSISKNDLFVDLSIMSLCSYGIMSNSSISWWGGYLMKKRKILFGPKYWLGWKRKIVFQAGGEPSFARLIDPNKFI
tara:strand:+ start:769 stop:1695 length:927 start_codon:yes stop_codon:yes gene_type:complete